MELDNQAEVKLRQGVTKKRCISIEDAEMRHERKSRSERINGYKCHVHNPHQGYDLPFLASKEAASMLIKGSAPLPPITVGN